MPALLFVQLIAYRNGNENPLIREGLPTFSTTSALPLCRSVEAFPLSSDGIRSIHSTGRSPAGDYCRNCFPVECWSTSTDHRYYCRKSLSLVQRPLAELCWRQQTPRLCSPISPRSSGILELGSDCLSDRHLRCDCSCLSGRALHGRRCKFPLLWRQGRICHRPGYQSFPGAIGPWQSDSSRPTSGLTGTVCGSKGLRWRIVSLRFWGYSCYRKLPWIAPHGRWCWVPCWALLCIEKLDAPVGSNLRCWRFSEQVLQPCCFRIWFLCGRTKSDHVLHHNKPHQEWRICCSQDSCNHTRSIAHCLDTHERVRWFPRWIGLRRKAPKWNSYLDRRRLKNVEQLVNSLWKKISIINQPSVLSFLHFARSTFSDENSRK